MMLVMKLVGLGLISGVIVSSVEIRVHSVELGVPPVEFSLMLDKMIVAS